MMETVETQLRKETRGAWHMRHGCRGDEGGEAGCMAPFHRVLVAVDEPDVEGEGADRDGKEREEQHQRLPKLLAVHAHLP